MFVLRLMHFFHRYNKKKPIMHMTGDEKIWAIYAMRTSSRSKYFDVQVSD